MENWIKQALAAGFTAAVPVAVEALRPRQDIRDMCAADKCGAYGKNWTCPPYCGTLEECSHRLGQYRRGILLQTTGTLSKTIDTKAFRQTEEKHLQQLYRFAELVRLTYPQALCLGSGGCRLCKTCAWPEACRFPGSAIPSMEGYGLFVTDVCRASGLPYHYGEKTVTYTGCILFPDD